MTDKEIRTRLMARLHAVEQRIADACRRSGRRRTEVTLVAVTKTVGVRVVRMLTELGVRDLGESRPQVLWRKADALGDLPIRWHMIGHLQRNKVQDTVYRVGLIHSVDSLPLLEMINNLAIKGSIRAPVLLQVNVSREATKHGFNTSDVLALRDTLVRRYSHVDINGLMTMAPFVEDAEKCRRYFRELRQLRDSLESGVKWNDAGEKLPYLSMGMSNDFEVAIEEGATHIRLGTILFEGLPSDEEES
jgi:pyridoxal phosphate enzyme (YggS family)